MLEPSQLYELLLPRMLACIGLLLLLSVSRLIIVVKLIVLHLRLARFREVHELALHDAEAVEQLEDSSGVEKRVPCLDGVLALLEEAESFEVAHDGLVLRKLADQAPHRLTQLW